MFLASLQLDDSPGQTAQIYIFEPLYHEGWDMTDTYERYQNITYPRRRQHQQTLGRREQDKHFPALDSAYHRIRPRACSRPRALASNSLFAQHE